MDERRRHVRAKPTADLPSHVLFEQSPVITEALDVIDISVSGVAIVQSSMTKALPAIDSMMKLKLVIDTNTVPFEGKVRWVAKGMIGLELVNPSADTSKTIQRYVSELLERGGRS
jgi:hypothetical protein